MKKIRKNNQELKMNINNAIRLAFENHLKGNLKQAELRYRKLLRKQPDNPDILHMLGVLFCQVSNYDLAIKYIRKALQFKPANSEAHCNLGVALQEKGQVDEAIAHYQKALELKPSFVKVHCNLGNALQEKGKIDEAITYCKKAIMIDPSFAEAYCNMGIALLGKGDLDKAIANYEKALELNPQSESTNLNMSLIVLLSGNFRQGWEQFEWRWKEKSFLRRNSSHQPHEFSQPVWDGSSLEEKSIFIFAEQGIGDEIMFASCFQEIIEQARECIVECDKRLIPIFSNSFPKGIFRKVIPVHMNFLRQTW